MFKIFCTIILFFSLCSCGFHSIYQSDNISSKVEYLPPIRIIEGGLAVKDKKVHRIFFDKISDELKIDSKTYKYLLYAKLSDSISGAATTSTGSTGRYKYTLSLNYSLVNAESGEQISSGVIKSISSYESSISRFTTYSSELDTLDNLIESILQKLKLKLATSINKDSNYKEL